MVERVALAAPEWLTAMTFRSRCAVAVIQSATACREPQRVSGNIAKGDLDDAGRRWPGASEIVTPDARSATGNHAALAETPVWHRGVRGRRSTYRGSSEISAGEYADLSSAHRTAAGRTAAEHDSPRAWDSSTATLGETER